MGEEDAEQRERRRTSKRRSSIAGREEFRQECENSRPTVFSRKGRYGSYKAFVCDFVAYVTVTMGQGGRGAR